jgi:enoyl-CoA hydratase
VTHVSVEISDHIATVTLDRPPVNAVDRATLAEIGDVFAHLGDDRDVRAAIFTGAGTKAFMAGADLRSMGDDDRDQWPAAWVTDQGVVAREALWAVYDCPVPVIAAINGAAIGAGLAFAAVCDVIIAAEGARFGTTEINVGLLGASAHLSLLLGRHKVRELYMTGELVDAAEFHRLGAVREVVPPDELMETALELATTLAKKSPIAMRLAKEALNRVEFLPLKDAYRIEQDYTRRLASYDDAEEARLAFVEQRDPEWRWR